MHVSTSNLTVDGETLQWTGRAPHPRWFRLQKLNQAQVSSGALIYFTLQSTPPLSSPLLPHSQPNSMLTVYVSIVTYQGIPVSSYDVGSGLNGLPLTGN